MNNNSHPNGKKRNCEGQIILPFLPEWYCYLCRQNKVEKPLVKGYLGAKREKQPDKILNLHLTCTLFIPELHLFFSSQDGFEVFNISKVQTEDYQCLICQDSGNPKKGYSIKCREDSCNNKTHLACINKTRIYKQENEQKLLKCFTLCRQHARSNPQPYETTYEKLFNEIQNEWIIVYRQLEEQEKQRQIQEKAQQQQNLKGKGGSNKRNNSLANANSNVKQPVQAKSQLDQASKSRSNNSRHSVHNVQEQLFEANQGNQQSETSGIGNNSIITSTAVDIYQDSHSQNNLPFDNNLDYMSDSRKKRGRPPKSKEYIQSFQSKNQQSGEGNSQSEEKGENYDSTSKRVFIETSQEIVSFRRDQPVCSPFDSSTIGAVNSNNDTFLNRGDDLTSPTMQEKKLNDKCDQSNQNEEKQEENAYTLLFGHFIKQEEKHLSLSKPNTVNKQSIISSTQEGESCKQEQAGAEVTDEQGENNTIAPSLQCRRSSRQEMNLQQKKNEKQQNSQQLKNKRGNSFDQSSTLQVNGNLSTSIYDNPFNKILMHQDNADDNQSKLGNIRSGRSASAHQFKQVEKEVIEIQEEEEQYLECGYPNYNDEKRQQSMEQWWFKIDSEYFTSPPNPSQIISDVLSTLNIKPDYLSVPLASNRPSQIQSDSSKKKHQENKQQQYYYQIYYPKHMKAEHINNFYHTPVADLYIKCLQFENKEIDNENSQEKHDEQFGYQMDENQFMELESEEEICLKEEYSENDELQNTIPLKLSAKKGEKKPKRKESAKKEQQPEIVKVSSTKKSRSGKDKQDQNRYGNFDSQLLIKNLRDSTSCRENTLGNMLIVDCDDKYQDEEDPEALKEEEDCEEENIQDKLQNQQENQQKNICSIEALDQQQKQQSDGSIDIENDIFKDSNTQDKNQKASSSHQNLNEMIEKKEEEEEQVEIESSNKISNEMQVTIQSEIKIEEGENAIIEVKQVENEQINEEEIIKKEENSDIINEVKIEEKPFEQNISYPFPQPSQIRQKSSQVKQQPDDKRKYIHYYSPEYVQEPLPIKINKKFTVLYHSVNGDGYLMVYDVNENADIKRSMTAKNKSEYSVCGGLQETQKLNDFLNTYKNTPAPGIDENNRRRAIPTSDTTPQLMFSKIIHLDKDALQLAIHEQIDLNKQFSENTNRRRRANSEQVDYMLLRNLFFEKQWCMNQKRFSDWQQSVYKQIDEDRDITYLKKQSTLIWDNLKLSQTKKNIIIGYADKEEYNTEIYFMVSSDDERDHEKHSPPTKKPSVQPTKEENKTEGQQEQKQNNDETEIVKLEENKMAIESNISENIPSEQINDSNPIVQKSEIEQQQQQQLLQQSEQCVSTQQDQQSSKLIEDINKIEEEGNKVPLQETAAQPEEEIQNQKESVMKETYSQVDSRKGSENQELSNNEQNQGEKMQIEGQSEQQEDQLQSKLGGSEIKQRRKSSIIKKNPPNKKSDEISKLLNSSKPDESNQQKESQNQCASEQKSKLRARKPTIQQPQKLSAYMKNKQKLLGNQSSGDTKLPLSKASTIFENLKKGNPLTKKMKKHPQFKQKEQLETDCMICFSQKNTDNNPVVYCSDCQQSFHKICYGIEEVPEGKFYCDKCGIIRTLKHKDRYQRDILQQRFSCPLCVETDLPIKLIYQRQSSQDYYSSNLDHYNNTYTNEEFRKNIDPSISPSSIESKLNNHGELWMHPFCMITFNIAKFDDGEIILKNLDFPTPSNYSSNKDNLRSESSISSEDIFSIIKCQICQRSHGHTVRCCESDCEEYFHPLCAFFQGLQCKIVEKPFPKEIIEKNVPAKEKRNQKNQKNTHDNQMSLDMSDFGEQEQLEFEIRCKRHVKLNRVLLQEQEGSNSQKMEIETSKGELSLEIKQLQLNLKQDLDFYLKQIFYRRFGVNYEKICSNFYYYDDFSQEVYSKNNFKVRFYNPHSRDYQSLNEILSFIEFGPQTKSQKALANNKPNQIQNFHNEEITNSKNQAEEEEFEYEMDMDYYEEDEDEQEQDRGDEHDEEEDDDEDIQMKDEDEELQSSNRKRGYKQKPVRKQQGESGLKPMQTYRKPTKQQRQQIQQIEEDSSDNLSSQINKPKFNKNQYKIIDEEDGDQSMKEEKEQQDQISNSPKKNLENQQGLNNNQSKPKEEVEENVFDQYQLESDYGSYDNDENDINQSNNQSNDKNSGEANSAS